MTGLDLTIRAIPMALGFLFGLYILGPAFRARPILWALTIIASWPVMLIGTLSLALGYHPKVPVIGLVPISATNLFYVSSVIWGLLFAGRYAQPRSGDIPKSLEVVRRFNLLLINLLPVAILIVSTSSVYVKVASKGFFSSSVYMAGLDEECRGVVLWRGEGALVYRCEGDVRVVIGPENVPLVADEAFTLERRLFCLVRCDMF